MRTGPASSGPATARVPRPRNSRKKRGKRRASAARHGLAYRAFRASLIVLLLFGGLAGIGAFRLARGPVSLSAFNGFIERAVTGELGGNRFTLRDAQLSLGEDGLEIALSDVRISQPDGVPLVQAPSALAGLSARALLSGRLGFSRVDLVNPRLQFFYAEDGTLSVKFAQPAETTFPDGATEPAAGTPQISAAAPPESAGPINFVETLTELSAKARRRESATAFLREIGLRQATVIVDNGRRKTIWRVPEVKIDLRHKVNSSLIDGRAVIDGLTGPWSLDFHTVEAAQAQQILMLADVHDLNPRGLSRQLPALANFEQVDVPLDGELRIDLSSKGVVAGATFALTARPGKIQIAGVQDTPAVVEAGVIKGAYDASASRITFSEVSLSVDHNRLDLTGRAVRSPAPASNGLPLWSFEFASTSGTLAPAAPAGAPVAIDQFHLRGQLIPDAGQLLLQEVQLSAGGAALTAKGSVSDLATDASRSTDIEASLAPVAVSRLLALWPSTVAAEARGWIAGHVTKGQLSSGTVRLAGSGDNRVSLGLELTGLELVAAPSLPPLQVPRARVRLEGGALEISAPDAAIGAAKQALQLKSVRVTTGYPPDGTTPVAEVSFRVLGPLAAALDFADREPFRLLKSRGIVLHAPEGRLDGQFKLTVPISETLAASDVTAEGHLRLTDGQLRQALGPNDITGAKLTAELSATAIDLRGDFLLKGIAVKFIGQHFLNSAPERQSPIRLNLKLDDADRSQLGLDINDLISGEVPVEVLVGPDTKGEYQVHLSADLTNAEMTLDSVAFRKPPGSAASVQFDPVKVANGRTELRNFKIAGKSIAAEGMIVLGADNKPKDVTFPEFSLNTVTRMDIRSHLRPDNIWEMHAKGITFDGRDLFRDLFNVQNQPKPVPKTKPGLDLTADIDTVVGFSDTNLKAVHLTMQKRTDSGFEKTTSLNVDAKHENGRAFEAQIRPTAPGQFKLTATSEDAGQTFKTIGFYPNAAGGTMSLEVDLDGKGGIERNGTLKAQNFAALGDPVISEVFQTSDGPAPPSGRLRKRVVREKIDFDWMVLPFSVGSGQFVMNGAEIRGPLVGARMRGKVDFKSQRMQIGGTYIPLSGLNSALGGLPVLGQLLAGPNGEGIFGVTFVIQGPLAAPEVLVNPFSPFVPGILRETQQMAPESYKITPRADPPPAPIPKSAARASSASPAATGRSTGAAVPVPQPPGVISDWTSDSKPEPRARAKAQAEQ